MKGNPFWLLLVGSSLVACAPTRPPAGPSPEPAGVERWEEAIRQFEAEDRARPPREGSVVFVGSSSIRMWESLDRDLPSADPVNRGFGGSQLEDVLHYADRIILPHRPRMVVVYAGDNDLAAGKSPERVLSDYRALVQRIHQHLPEARIAFIAIKPSLARWHLVDAVREANERVRRFSMQDPRLHYVDVFTPMLGPDGTPREELFLDDGLHMTPRGYEVWRSVLAPLLTER